MFFAFGATHGVAQVGADPSKGSIGVEVTDATGGVIQNATVILTGPMGAQRGSTNDRGQAVFYSLVPGTYAVKVEFQGFRAYEAPGIPVSAAQRVNVRAQLEPGAVTETVQVTGTAAMVDTTTTTTGTSIEQGTFQNLPIARNVTALFSIAPGVAPSGDPVMGTANPSISGGTGLENQYIIDGINTTDQGYGAFGVFSNVYGSMGTGVNFDFVREVQVKTGGFEAQYGQALGGVVNVVTESGGNDIHGAAYVYGAPGWAEGTYRQASDFNRVSRPITETHGRKGYDFGFNIGGPLVRDRMFWYGAFNPSFNFQDRVAPPGYLLRDQGPIERKVRAYNWVGKLNFNITDAHRLEGTAFGDPSKEPISVLRALTRDDRDSASELEYGTRNWAVKYNGLLTHTTILNGSFAWNHTSFTETPAQNTFGLRDYSVRKPTAAYTLTGGVGFMENNEGDNRQYNVMLTKTATVLGGHQFDIGYGYNDVTYDAIRLYSGPNWALPQAAGIVPADIGKEVFGGYFYLRPTATVGGRPVQNVYQLARGNYSDPAVSTKTDYNNAFVQDAWQINRYLTAKLGVRWEQQHIGGNLNSYTFAGNWAPRLGFIVDPFGTRRTKFFANWGRFFEKIPQDLAVRAMSEEFAYLNLYFSSLPPTQQSLVPGSVGAPTGVHPTIIYGGTKAQYQEEVVVGLEREVGPSIVLGAKFIYRDLKRTLEDISGVTVEAYNAGISQDYVIANPRADLDIITNPVACTSGPNCDPDIGFTLNSGKLGADGQVDTFPDPRRIYRALELTAEKRFSQNWSLIANYRLAKLHGNYEGLFRNDNGQSDPNITSMFDFVWSPALADQFQVGVLPTDRRHIANLMGNYMIGNFNVGLRWQALTGTPISKFDSHPGYLNEGEIPVGGRGSFGRTPFQNYFDLNLQYRLPLGSDSRRLKVQADLFNLFNRRTVTEVDQYNELSGAIPNQDFLKPYRLYRPFYARFAVRYEF
jgi:hypothetical protein